MAKIVYARPINKSHRTIKGEQFNNPVNPPEPQLANNPNHNPFKDKGMFKSILRSITKPFRQKPTIDINTKDDGVFWVVTLTLKWFVADLNIKIQFDSTNRDAFISVRLNGRTLVEREI